MGARFRIPAALTAFVVAVPLLVAPSTALAGDLADTADEKGAWVMNHIAGTHPGIGGVASQLVVDSPTTTNIVRYQGIGDSTAHTSSYLASQAYRYAATGDPAAKQNAIDAVQRLHAHLDATTYTNTVEVAPARAGKPYLARYVGPNGPVFEGSIQNGCDNRPDCHRIVGGPYDAHFWIGRTSIDHYIYWYYPHAHPSDLVDDEPTRQRIAHDAAALGDQLRLDGWVVRDVDGTTLPTGTRASPIVQVAILSIVAHVTGDPQRRSQFSANANASLLGVLLTTTNFLNNYFDYFAHYLAHMAFYSLVKYEHDDARRGWWRSAFRSNVGNHLRGQHQVLFDYMHLAIFGLADAAILAAARTSLGDMPATVPLRFVQPVVNENVAFDPLSVRLYNFNAWLRDLFPEIPQKFRKRTVEARPIAERCVVHNLWERTPFTITCTGSDTEPSVGEDPTVILYGVDYLQAYWMGRYYGYLDATD